MSLPPSPPPYPSNAFLLVIKLSEQRARPSTGECRDKELLGNSVLGKAKNAPVILPRKFWIQMWARAGCTDLAGGSQFTPTVTAICAGLVHGWQPSWIGSYSRAAAVWDFLGSRHIPFSALTTPPPEEEEPRRKAMSDVQSRSVLAASHSDHSGKLQA